MNLPQSGRSQQVRLHVAAAATQQEWSRQIGSSVLRTRQSALGSRLVERNGIGRVTFDLAVQDGALLYRQASIAVAGLVIPPFISPRVAARVSPEGPGWHVDVAVTWRGHLVCRYGGAMEVA
jgi:hypothetical protein